MLPPGLVVPATEVTVMQSDTREVAVWFSPPAPSTQVSPSDTSMAILEKGEAVGPGEDASLLPPGFDRTLIETVSDLLSRVEILEGRIDALGVDSDHVCPKLVKSHVESTAKMWTDVDVCELRPSIWDVCVLLGMDIVGLGESCVLLLVFVLNLTLQISFVWIVYTSMLVDPVSSTDLDGLLRFRLGVAHSAIYADPVEHTSMIEKVCGEDGALHISAGQARLHLDARLFSRDGMGLCLLAQTVWFVTVLAELNETLRFALVVLCVPSSAGTQILHSGEAGETRLAALSCRRRVCLFALVVLPRLVIAMCLGFVGSWYLSWLINKADLVLNVLALAFILSLDEELFGIFAPLRSRITLSHIKPLLVTRVRMPSAILPLLRMMIVAFSVLLVVHFSIRPFFGRLELAQNILCSGNTDFIYAHNPASDIVHAAKARIYAHEWSSTEKAVLQLAMPTLSSENGWRLSSDLVDAMSEEVPRTVVVPNRSVPLSQSLFSESSFDMVLSLSTQSVSEGASFLLCEELTAGPSYEASLLELQSIVSSASILGCDDRLLLVPLCAHANMTRLRALCPVTCGCRDFHGVADVQDYTGWPATIFGSESYGCPAGCVALRSAYDAYRSHPAGIVNPNLTALGCEDATPVSLTNRDIDFNTFSAVDADGMFIRYDHDTVYLPRWLHSYLTGLFSVLLQESTFPAFVWNGVADLVRWGFVPEVWQHHLWEHVVSAEIVHTIVSGTWEVMPGLRHPRNLTGCSYLASYELIILLGRDLCEASDFRSIRNICPRTCGCGGATPECPGVCGSGG